MDKARTRQRLMACAEAEIHQLAVLMAARVNALLTFEEAASYGVCLRQLARGQEVIWPTELQRVGDKIKQDPNLAELGAQARQIVLAIEGYDPGPVPPIPSAGGKPTRLVCRRR